MPDISDFSKGRKYAALRPGAARVESITYMDNSKAGPYLLFSCTDHRGLRWTGHVPCESIELMPGILPPLGVQEEMERIDQEDSIGGGASG